MFCRLKLGPQDSRLSQVFLHSSTRCQFTERRGGGVVFLLRFVFRAFNKRKQLLLWLLLWESHILPIRDLKFYCFNAANRLRLFQDSILKCLKVTILPFKKK